MQHSSEWQIALSKYRDDGNDSLTTPLAPNAVSASPSHSTDETKVLNKVHQCVLFTKAKRRCHNLTHTLHAHTPTHSLTQPHTHTQSGACITLSGARREFRIYATMLPTRPDDTSAQRECLCHSPFLCMRHCLCVCVSVPWCVCV